MPATPAWPPQSTPRLFVETELAPGEIRLDGPAAHYLGQVMRIKPGDPVKLFDDKTGEWQITEPVLQDPDTIYAHTKNK